jgi:hypothetical protein
MSRVDSPLGRAASQRTAAEEVPVQVGSVSLSKELQVRHRILAIYNKELEDFDDKAAYDDYLEEREDIMFNLSQGIDVAAMEAAVRAYQEREGESIGRNEARRLGRVLKEEAAAEAEEGRGRGREDGVAGQVPVEMVGVGVDDGGLRLMDEDELNGVLKKQTKEARARMAACSGWKTGWYEMRCRALFAT